MKAWMNAALGRYQVMRPDGSMTFRARYVMEVHIGRRLARDEHVHHINGDKTDDRLENLRVVSPAEHAALHGPDISAGIRATWQHDWSRDHAACVTCGRTDRKHQGRGLCSYCYFMDRERTKRGRPPREPRAFVTLTCPECGTDFTRTMSCRKQKFCSRACSSSAVNRRRWAAHREASR
jgi:endogenous inhibitor of DNA gyrase (YacG/DUF329 family)